jgi:hypothetical protein
MVRKKNCTKAKCKQNSCGPRGMTAIKKFITSPKFFIYYLTVFVVFLIIRVFRIPYGSPNRVDLVLCYAMFALGTLLQFLVLYVFLLITFFVLDLIIKIIRLLIKWIRALLKKRKSGKLIQRIGNFFVRLGLIILLTIVFFFLYYVLKGYTLLLYYAFGLVMGYTVIGSNNECIAPPKKKKL